MPPKKDSTKKVPKKPVLKCKGTPRGMSKPILPGLEMTDLMKKQWKLGPVIGQGGFGYIYLGDTLSSKEVTQNNANNVIKVEPHANGPLFVELAFYQRVAKSDMINSWAKSNKKKYLGIPVYIGTGSFEHEGTKYRFMVMDRFGTDVEKIYKEHNFQFPEKTVYSLGLRILDTLEYIHENEYVHADIKSSNLMMGFNKADQTKVYLLDYGLAYRYCPNGKHVPYKEDPKRKHDGTIEYTSRDAHRGCAPSRRGDMEILGFCMMQWLCKRLPWEDNLENKDYVFKQKTKYMDDIDAFVKSCFSAGNTPTHLREYLKLVASLKYDERPNYKKMRSLFSDGLSKCGFKDDDVSVCLPSKKPSPQKRRATVDDSDSSPSPKKRQRGKQKDVSPLSSPSAKKRQRSATPKKTSSKNLTAKAPATGAGLSKARSPRKSPLKKTKTQTAEQKVNGETRTVHRRPRRKNVPTRDFAQSP